jgi:sn-glycerol 3-phosphate transport system permease protein
MKVKKGIFHNPILPYVLVAPQLIITLLFFFWPAGQAIIQAFLISDPFGGGSEFVWFENFQNVLSSPEYLHSVITTLIFSGLTALISMSSGLAIAVMVNRIKVSKKLLQSMLIWPYAIAPAMAGVLWVFLLHPTFGAIGYFLIHNLGFDWNPVLEPNHALSMVVLASAWKQVSYNFIFFLSGLQSIPTSLMEAAAIDGAGPFKRFWKIIFPLLSPTGFFLLVMNLVYSFFDTFGVIHTTTEGGPGGATNTLVYKVYSDGFVGLDLGASAAQSVLLMALTIILTIIQFKYIEKKVHY